MAIALPAKPRHEQHRQRVADVALLFRGLLACYSAQQALHAIRCAASIEAELPKSLCCAHLCCRSNVVTEDLDKLFVKKKSPARKAAS
jgi:hypothetical protein